VNSDPRLYPGEVVEFYDPHPGIGGAAIPMPEHLRIVAQWLVGQRMSVEEAMQCFRDVAEAIRVRTYQDCILVEMGSLDDLPMHGWRAIRFRVIKPQHDS
jgi:hypothetical protein